MTQKFEKGTRYKAEIVFEVRQDQPELGVVITTLGNRLVRNNLDKIEKVRDRFEQGALYQDRITSRVYRRTGFDLVDDHPKWDEVGHGYVHEPGIVHEESLERLYYEEERK